MGLTGEMIVDLYNGTLNTVSMLVLAWIAARYYRNGDP